MLLRQNTKKTKISCQEFLGARKQTNKQTRAANTHAHLGTGMLTNRQYTFTQDKYQHYITDLPSSSSSSYSSSSSSSHTWAAALWTFCKLTYINCTAGYIWSKQAISLQTTYNARVIYVINRQVINEDDGKGVAAENLSAKKSDQNSYSLNSFVLRRKSYSIAVTAATHLSTLP